MWALYALSLDALTELSLFLLPYPLGDYVWWVTAEGDTIVMQLQLSRFLVKQANACRKSHAPPPPPQLAYLHPLTKAAGTSGTLTGEALLEHLEGLAPKAAAHPAEFRDLSALRGRFPPSPLFSTVARSLYCSGVVVCLVSPHGFCVWRCADTPTALS